MHAIFTGASDNRLDWYAQPADCMHFHVNLQRYVSMNVDTPTTVPRSPFRSRLWV